VKKHSAREVLEMIREDLSEAVLYAYFAIRYFDEHIFKVI
jgi:hypothetical protein